MCCEMAKAVQLRNKNNKTVYNTRYFQALNHRNTILALHGLTSGIERVPVFLCLKRPNSASVYYNINKLLSEIISKIT